MDDKRSITAEDLATSREAFSSERANVIAKNAVSSVGLRKAARVPEGVAQNRATLQIISRLCSLAAVFLAAFLVVYYGNALLLRLHGHLLDRQGNVTTLSFALSRVLIHGLQNMLIVVAWQAVARRLSHRTAHFADAVNIVVPPVAFMATAWLLPHLSPNLTLSFSMSPVLAFLLLCLFHALTLRVENVLDRSLALILFVTPTAQETSFARL